MAIRQDRRMDAFRMNVVVVEDEAGLDRHAAAWQELADDTLEPNVFYEPWLLRPAMQLLPKATPLRLVFIYDESPGAPQLCGFFPLMPDANFRGLPLQAWRLLRHVHCFLCTPLLRPGRHREALAALLRWADGDGNVQLLNFAHVGGDGPFHDLLLDNAQRSGLKHRITYRRERALWRAGRDPQDYLQEILPGVVRKEYRRQRRRLAELGRLEFRAWREGEPSEPWLEDFLALEAGGWKATQGQPLAMHADQHAFARAAVAAAAARGRLLFHGLYLDCRPVAMLLSFRSGSGAFAFKTAYDEALAKYSPGVQLMLDILGWVHGDARIGWMDSCAEPDHPMIDRLWIDRKAIAAVIVSTGSRRGDLAIAALPAARRLVHLARAVRDGGLHALR